MAISYKHKIYIGKSINWNQLLQNPNFSNEVVDTRTYVSFRVQQLASPYESFLAAELEKPSLVNAIFTIPVSGDCRIKHNGEKFDIDFCYFTAVKDHKYYIYINFISTNPSIANGVAYNKAQFFDLTQMFGAGNEPSTPEEFWSYFENKVYPYNAGETQPLFKISRKRKLYMGKSIEWNQLFDKNATPNRNSAAITYAVDGDVNTLTTTSAITTSYFNFSCSTVSGHKHMICARSLEWTSPNHSGLFIGGDAHPDTASYATLTSSDLSKFFTATGDTCYIKGYISYSAGDYVFKMKGLQLFDLTQMFGDGNEPSTVEEFWSYFENKVYPYNEGETQPLFKISRKSVYGRSVVSYPNKGDLITLDGKEYRVLKTIGTVAEVLAMYDATNSQRFSNTSASNTYENSALDTYCTSTFYNSLSTNIKNAIVEKTFQQDLWSNTSSGSIASYIAEEYFGRSYDLYLKNMAFGNSISRKCYVLSVQDIIDYLDATSSMNGSNTVTTSENVMKMFFDQTSPTWSNEDSIILRSASDYNISGVQKFCYKVSYLGGLTNSAVFYSGSVRPVFQIDLSKIDWTYIPEKQRLYVGEDVVIPQIILE